MAALKPHPGPRINPGNIKYQDKVRLIARGEGSRRADPDRSQRWTLERDLLAKYGNPTAEVLVEELNEGTSSRTRNSSTSRSA